jgi:alpha-D-xyloside xylohydrolase
MMLEFPDDLTCHTLDLQYMVGESLLVAPVFTPEGTVDYYLPEGRWTNFLTGQTVEGGRWVRETHNYLSLPLMVRPNSILAVGNNDQKPAYDYADGVMFHVFELQDGTTLSAYVPAIKGDVTMTVEMSRTGQQIHVQAQGASKPWSVLLRGIGSVQSVESGTTQADARGTLLIPAEDTSDLTIHL